MTQSPKAKTTRAVLSALGLVTVAGSAACGTANPTPDVAVGADSINVFDVPFVDTVNVLFDVVPLDASDAGGGETSPAEGGNADGSSG